MPSDYSKIWPFVIAIVAVLVIYRRFRRNFGRQVLHPKRMWVRIGILVVVGCLLLPAALASAQIVAADLGGLAVGIALAAWGARRTRYQNYGGQLYYIPHTYTGIAISLLFIGRLLFRVGTLAALDTTQAFAPSAMGRSPLTFGFFYVLVGYYVCYYALVLRKSKHLGPEDIEEESSAAAPS